MFEKLTYEAKNNFRDTGLLAESLIFYQSTNIILDPKSFKKLLDQVGYENALELINENALELKINCQGIGGGNKNGNVFLINAWSDDKYNKEYVIENSIKDLFGSGVDSTKKIQKLHEIVLEHKYDSEFVKIANSELGDAENLKETISIITNNEYNSENIDIDIQSTDIGWYEIESNVPNDIIDQACFLIGTGASKIFNSKIYESELATNNKTQFYPNRRIERILNKRKESKEDISTFHEFVLPKFYDLSGTINSGEHSFDEFMVLWRAAKQFKQWLKEEDPNSKLLEAYLNEISKENFLSKLPVKSIRWMLFTMIGLAAGDVTGGVAGTAASVGVDFLDDIVLDGMLKRQNWKPNVFVKGDYQNFLKFGI